MHYDAEKHHRRSIRLADYDYNQFGAYFITVCTKNRECLFGEIVDGEMRLNEFGRAVEDEWLRTPSVRPEIDIDAFVIMPNHVHGVVCFVDEKGTARRAPTKERFGHPLKGTLPTIVRAFKSAAAVRINKIRRAPGEPVWQRNYYEHVIRDENELNRIREYIRDNPAAWQTDQENPAATKTEDREPWQ
jgi:REP-associated tyrosine transposase